MYAMLVLYIISQDSVHHQHKIYSTNEYQSACCHTSIIIISFSKSSKDVTFIVAINSFTIIFISQIVNVLTHKINFIIILLWKYEKLQGKEVLLLPCQVLSFVGIRGFTLVKSFSWYVGVNFQFYLNSNIFNLFLYNIMSDHDPFTELFFDIICVNRNLMITLYFMLFKVFLLPLPQH